MSADKPYIIAKAQMRGVSSRNLGLDEKGTRLSAVTAHACALRAALWALSKAGTDSVHVTRLLYAAKRLAEPLLMQEVTVDGQAPSNAGEDTALSELRMALEELEVVGDVARLSGGRWLPAPLRCVALTVIHRWLLVGGCPTHCLPPAFTSLVTHSGTVRLLTHDPAQSGVSLHQQSEAAWASRPREPVATQARQALENAVVLPFSDCEQTLEFYSPTATQGMGPRSALQYFRWTQNTRHMPDGRYLSRTPSHRFHYRYLVAEIRKGQVVATGPLALQEGDVRRVLYGLDAEAGLPVTATVVRTKESWRFELRNEVPRSEHRLLMALGYLHLPANTYYPRIWEVPAVFSAQVVTALERLGMRVYPHGHRDVSG